MKYIGLTRPSCTLCASKESHIFCSLQRWNKQPQKWCNVHERKIADCGSGWQGKTIIWWYLQFWNKQPQKWCNVHERKIADCGSGWRGKTIIWWYLQFWNKQPQKRCNVHERKIADFGSGWQRKATVFDGTCNFETNSLRSGAMFMKER